MTKPKDLSDRQKKMILDRALPDKVLGERFGMSTNYIGLTRARLKAEAESQEAKA